MEEYVKCNCCHYDKRMEEVIEAPDGYYYCKLCCVVSFPEIKVNYEEKR